VRELDIGGQVKILADEDRQTVEIVFVDRDLPLDASRLDLRQLMRDTTLLDLARTVNPETALFVLSELTEAGVRVSDLLVRVESYANRVTRRLREERARVLLEETPKEIERLGVANTKDNRDAVVDRWPTVTQDESTLEQLHSIGAWIRTRKEAFRQAHSSARAWLGERQYSRRNIPANSGTAEVGLGEINKQTFGSRY
jgi:hypothetical protein